MAKRPPFRAEEKAEIERAGRSVFYGDAIVDKDTGVVIPGYEEIWELRKKWWPIIALFLRCVSKKNGEFLHLPVSGGAEEQPFKTMTALEVLQEVYIGKMSEDNKKHAADQQAKIQSMRVSRGRSR